MLFSKEEKRVVINLKKALVSGFQANFEGRTMVTESDHETEHISHYRLVERYFTYADILKRTGVHIN